MDRAEFERWMTAHASFRVTCTTCWYPDDEPAEAHAPADFTLCAEANGLTWLSWDGHAFARMSVPTAADLSALAGEAAGSTGRSRGVDTAVGRYITTVLVDAGRQGRSTGHAYHFNHYDLDDGLDDPPWRSLFEQVLRLLEAGLGAPDRDRLRFVLDRFAPRRPPEGYLEGRVVDLSGSCRLQPVPLGSGMYLRIGQPPGPTCLLLFRPRGGEVEVCHVPGRDAPRPLGLLAPPEVPRAARRAVSAASIPELRRWSNLDLRVPGLEDFRGRRFEFEVSSGGGDALFVSSSSPRLGVYVQRA